MLNFPAILSVSKVQGSHVFAIDTANTDMVFLFSGEGLCSPRLIFLGKVGELCGGVQKHKSPVTCH